MLPQHLTFLSALFTDSMTIFRLRMLRGFVLVFPVWFHEVN